MEDNFYNPQNIEAYLRGKLSNADKEFFENGIQRDPLLQNEINLQKDIIGSLKEHRKADLKRRLNAIEIKSPWYYSTPMKVAASFTTIVVISVLSYFGFKSGDNSTLVAIDNKEVVAQIERETPKVDQIKPESAQTSSKQPETPTEVVSEKANKKAVKAEKKVEIQNVKPVVPSVNDDYNEEEFNPEHTLKVPEGNIVHSGDHKNSDLQVQIASTTEHSFHYQFFNNKLFLYCDFSSGPYELLELHNKKTRDLYLFYNNGYYEIKHNQQEVTPLRQIKNSSLIKQLSIIKDK